MVTCPAWRGRWSACSPCTSSAPWPRAPRSSRLGPLGSACWPACAVGCSNTSGGCRSHSSIVGPLGDLMSHVTNDVDTLNQLLSQGLTQLLGSLFGLVGIVIAMLLLNVPLALVSV